MEILNFKGRLSIVLFSLFLPCCMDVAYKKRKGCKEFSFYKKKKLIILNY